MIDICIKRNQMLNWNDAIYCIVLFVLCWISVLQRNVFFSNSDIFITLADSLEILMYVILIIIIIENRFPAKTLVVAAVIAVVLGVGYIKSGMAVFFRALLLILASRKISFEKVLKTVLLSFIFGIVISSLLYFLGLAPDSVSIWHFEGYGFGFGGGNAFGELLCLCNMIICYLLVNKHRSINLVLEFVLAIAIYFITTSKTATFIFALTPVLIISFDRFFRLKHTKFLRLFVYILNPFLFVFSYITAKVFLTNAFVQKLDDYFSNRFFLNYYAVSKYGLVLFGQKANYHDTGVYNSVRNIGNITVTVDNAYIISIISMGIIPSIIFVLGYFLLIKKSFKESNFALCAVAVLLCLYGFTEVKTIEIYDNFVYLSLLTNVLPIINRRLFFETKTINIKEAV